MSSSSNSPIIFMIVPWNYIAWDRLEEVSKNDGSTQATLQSRDINGSISDSTDLSEEYVPQAEDFARRKTLKMLDKFTNLLEADSEFWRCQENIEYFNYFKVTIMPSI